MTAISGKYSVEGNLKVKGMSLCSTTMNFTLIPSVKAEAVENCTYIPLAKAQLLSGEKIHHTTITDATAAAALQFSIVPIALEEEEVTYKVEPYGITKELPEGVEFDNEIENQLNIPEDTITYEILPYFQCKVTIFVNGFEQATIILGVSKE